MTKKTNGFNTAITKPDEEPTESDVKQTVIQIGDRTFVQKPLNADTYFEYQKRLTTHGSNIAIQWLIYESFGDIGFDKLRFREKGKLQNAVSSFDAKITFYDDKKLFETSDFQVGRHRYKEKRSSGSYYYDFIQEFPAPIAYKKAIERVFLIDGKSITKKHFEDANEISYGGAIALCNWFNCITSISPDSLGYTNQNILSGNTYFEYQKLIKSAPFSVAVDWLLRITYDLSDEKISALKFREKGALHLNVGGITEIVYHDNVDSLSESSDFSINGSRLTEKENSGDYYSEFVEQSTKGSVAYKKAIQNMFLLNGEEIKESDFEDPDQLGYVGALNLVEWINFIFAQNP